MRWCPIRQRECRAFAKRDRRAMRGRSDLLQSALLLLDDGARDAGLPSRDVGGDALAAAQVRCIRGVSGRGENYSLENRLKLLYCIRFLQYWTRSVQGGGECRYDRRVVDEAGDVQSQV